MKERRRTWFAPWALLVAAPWLMGQAAPEVDAAQRLLAVHNAARAELGLPPLVWKPELAAEAKSWADHLATTRDFAHSDGSTLSGHGENLWMGSKGAYTPEEMVDSWVREKRFFRSGRFPDNSTTGDWAAVAHYTQIVWRGTREIGCAVASNEEQEILVCHYAEPGNVEGEKPF
ncbi:MAG: SCP-like extracellular [Sphingobium sp.]|nr:SCP-like extracellular [Sphingobium sp.]